jgi:tRNA pseudouridine38-40 synthase
MTVSATKIACGIEYIGTQYCGWQLQDNNLSIQGVVEEAISRVADESVRVFASGRTDSGVHARGQVLHFVTTAFRTENQWRDGINTHLPNDVNILWVKEMSNDFDARRSAVSRTYQYLILNTTGNQVFTFNRALFIHHELDLDSMKSACSHFVGIRNFSSYRASSCQSKNPIRELKALTIVRKNHLITIECTANAFLHHMVRNIVGTLIDVGLKRVYSSDIPRIIEAQDRSLASKTSAAHGLYLQRVDYPDKFELPSFDIELI